MIPKNSRNCRKGLLGLHEHWRCVGPRATVEKTGQPVDPARLCFLFLSSPVLPAKTSKTQQADDFINFFISFVFPICLSLLLQICFTADRLFYGFFVCSKRFNRQI